MSEQAYTDLSARVTALEEHLDVVHTLSVESNTRLAEVERKLETLHAVRVERRDDQGMYVFGVDYNGAFLTIASIKTGLVDTLVENARVAAEQESQTDSE